MPLRHDSTGNGTRMLPFSVFPKGGLEIPSAFVGCHCHRPFKFEKVALPLCISGRGYSVKGDDFDGSISLPHLVMMSCPLLGVPHLGRDHFKAVSVDTKDQI